MRKEKYETPVIEIIHFETEDVITASGGDGITTEDYMTEILPDIW